MLRRTTLLSIALLVLITAVSQVFKTQLELINIALIHLLPVMIIALRGVMSATMIITTATVILFDLLYVPPQYSFDVHDLIYIWSFIIFYLVGYIITLQAKRIRINEIRQTLLRTLSHDLKTPLSSIIGNASLLIQSPSDAEAQREIALQIQMSAQRMDRLIATLLDGTRLQHAQNALKFEWCDFEDLIGVALQEFSSPDQQYRLRIHVDAHLKLFWGDAGLLLRLIVNLIDNALKYAPDQTPITLRVTAQAHHVVLTLCNAGEPIPQAELSSIFDRFYHLEHSADIHGSGIGLSICKEIAQAHHGSIRAYNDPQGICFEVLFPIKRHPLELEERP
ncbi:MAG: PAS domain-containing sensor histidine kinase [Campylobacterales bacterium]|nr:PAS domain-containing sensor histidine kinase [Campylobacterales bacterium]